MPGELAKTYFNFVGIDLITPKALIVSTNQKNKNRAVYCTAAVDTFIPQNPHRFLLKLRVCCCGVLIMTILRWGSCVAHVEAQNALNAAANICRHSKHKTFARIYFAKNARFWAPKKLNRLCTCMTGCSSKLGLAGHSWARAGASENHQHTPPSSSVGSEMKCNELSWPAYELMRAYVLLERDLLSWCN